MCCSSSEKVPVQLLYTQITEHTGEERGITPLSFAVFADGHLARGSN